MLKSLSLTNFQVHHDRTFDLSQPVSVLAGPTGSGKSAVFRALRWLTTNRPVGTDTLVRIGADTVKVKLVLSNGTVIVREKGPKGNFYYLNEQVFEAFGVDIPQPVLDALNLDADLNFQHQLDAPFWFSLSPGDVSKQLNRIINLEKIDSTLSHLATALRKSRYVVEVTEDRLKTVQDRLQSLMWVPQAQSAWEDVCRLQTTVQAKQTGVAELNTLLTELTEATVKLGNLEKIANDAQPWSALGAEIQTVTGQVDGLDQLLGELREKEQELCQVESQITEQTKELASLELCPVCRSPLNNLLPWSAPTSTCPTNHP